MSPERGEEQITMGSRVRSAVWLAPACFIMALTVTYVIRYERRLSAIVSDPVATIGHWTNKHCSLKGGFTEFTFSANGKDYVGAGNFEAEFCRSIEFGRPVDVTYNRSDPTINFGGKLSDIPEAMKQGYYNAFFVLLLLIGIVLLFTGREAIAERFRRRREETARKA